MTLPQLFSLFQSAPGNPDSGQLTLDHFQLLRVIGRGSYAKVLQVEHKKTKRIYAMKVIKKELVNDDEVCSLYLAAAINEHLFLNN